MNGDPQAPPAEAVATSSVLASNQADRCNCVGRCAGVGAGRHVQTRSEEGGGHPEKLRAEPPTQAQAAPKEVTHGNQETRSATKAGSTAETGSTPETRSTAATRPSDAFAQGGRRAPPASTMASTADLAGACADAEEELVSVERC